MGSGAGAKHLEDPSAAAGQSGPSATPAAPTAGVVPGAPSSEAPGDVVPESKPSELCPPYFGRLDLAIEDKARSMGVAPEAATKRSRLLVVSSCLIVLVV